MKLTFNLSNPHFTLLHRAGLAGLWMSLKQLEEETQVSNRPGQLSWELTPREVIIQWNGNDFEVLDWLLKESFQLEDGRICLRGLDSKTMPIQSQLILHQGILGTLLQHNKTHKSSGIVSKSFSIEPEKPEFVAKYKSLTWYVYQDAKNLCDKKGQLLTKPVKVPGWLNPGTTVRHTAFSADTSFEEPPEAAFVLLFAAVACCYYTIRSKLRDKRAQYALVVPEITDLETYANWRRNPKWREEGYKDFFASGLGDAGLKFLTYITEDVIQYRPIQRCQVLTLGTVAWATQQKTRTDLHLVESGERIEKNYKVCDNLLGDRVIAGKESAFISNSFARELVTENLARGKHWYSGIADNVTSNELFQKLTYERGGLNQMIQEVEWDRESEKLFVKACHEAIGYNHRELYKRAKDKGEVPNYEREDTKFRTGLARCKTAVSFREFITDYLSRARFMPTLEENWEQFMDLIMGAKDWKKGRDLALLALASYKRSNRSEKVAAEEPEDEDEIDFGV
ncbi:MULTISPECIES: type I-MYXAN CRISPR-associated Cas8a1/Cmx1 [unclassified Coleofasciculus]|uniref:type I-MYXAN CRISPR-associated Cas8a1/Cmx1 n=1 Tax=unclassified Coleofasciculus TaxID=2692782 RepID=UPI00187F2A2B|nr:MULTISPECIES: type I-MYXAN CRISPR-associated Cas8a1/Cmx1 [unclassified Coleofasciculus]MBE9125499.1 type I-MYXAN CRISPR-associated Cas8a1/Cmx1 [Coleofasciculus sp. LEGE 07081]MBE9148637.1 type I-MYXAN CRISPR-associated Cas8a1/Cmx1 [Coleofasciculus sp. LEGE 07092]